MRSRIDATMDFSATLLDLAGCIALLLWGTHMVQTGIQRACGAKLRMILGHGLRSRWRAFVAGVGVTALLQSSTATGLMAAGFAAGGFVDLVPALAVMLGANVGTTLIVQVLSFDVAAVSPALILLGVVLFRKGSVSPTRDVGRAFIGLGLMLLALHQLVGLLTPYEDQPSLRLFLGAIATTPIIAVLLSATATWLAHSSVAVILVVVSLASRGLVSPDAAFALVLGANLGTSINPLIEGVHGDDPAAKRLPIGNILIRAVGVIIALALMGPIGRLAVTLQADYGRVVADFHMAFNIVIALVAFPFLKAYAGLLTKLLPTRIDPADPSRPLYLDLAARETPLVALGGAAREALRMADVLETMLQNLQDAFIKADRRPIAEAKRLDDVLDNLNSAIKTYLTSIDPEGMNADDHRRLSEILAFSTNMEHAGDVIDRNLLPLAARRIKRGLDFSKIGLVELETMLSKVTTNLRRSASLLMVDDIRLARLLAEEKVIFRDLEAAATRAHFEQLRNGGPDSGEASALHIDALRDLQRINSHLIAASAYPVLERQGELLPSRMVAP
jgi:phosphate:Na+ symporter